MLRASVFSDFKSEGFTTLLLWGKNVDMEQLYKDLNDMRLERRTRTEVDGGVGQIALQIGLVVGRRVSFIKEVDGVRVWSLSPDQLIDVISLVEPLQSASSGHQYIDAGGGLVDQVMIAVNEYPEDLF